MKKEDTVKLISSEGFEFVVDKEAAIVSQTIHNMLTSPGSFAERQHGEVTFPEISTTILEKICQYFYWHLQFARWNYCLVVHSKGNQRIIVYIETVPLQDSDVRVALRCRRQQPEEMGSLPPTAVRLNYITTGL
ncbi:Elongin-C [Glycine max]|nr:Elongin-C [Glycine max]